MYIYYKTLTTYSQRKKKNNNNNKCCLPYTRYMLKVYQ